MARGSNAGSDSDALGGVGDGGAIAINPTNKNAQVTITNNSFTGNIANASDDIPDGGSNARGGAILADNGSGNGSIVVTLTNVSLINNIAKAGSGPGDGQGGAIYARKSNLILQGGVITGNIAARNGAERGQGGGIRLSTRRGMRSWQAPTMPTWRWSTPARSQRKPHPTRVENFAPLRARA